MFFSPDSRGLYTMHVRFWRFVQAQWSRAESVLGHHRLVIAHDNTESLKYSKVQ